MADWMFAGIKPDEEFAQLHFFSLTIPQNGGRKVEFRITVREYAKPNHLNMLFYAEADKQTNQRTAPFTAFGWGPTLLIALSECVKNIRRFPYEGEWPSMRDPQAAATSS